jgi:transcriptional antiterminator
MKKENIDDATQKFIEDFKELEDINKIGVIDHYESSRVKYYQDNIGGETHIEYYRNKYPKKYKLLVEKTEKIRKVLDKK